MMTRQEGTKASVQCPLFRFGTTQCATNFAKMFLSIFQIDYTLLLFYVRLLSFSLLVRRLDGTPRCNGNVEPTHMFECSGIHKEGPK